MGMMILTVNPTSQSCWLCMSLLKTLKNSDCAFYVILFHSYSILTLTSISIHNCESFYYLTVVIIALYSLSLKMYGVILVALVGVYCVNVSMIDYLCWYNCICCVGVSFNIASVHCQITFHVNEINYV